MTTLDIPDAYAPHHECISTSTSITETAVDPEETVEPSVPKDFPTTIPPQHDSCTLVLCFDGTGDQFHADNSNIVQLCSLLRKDDRSQQMVYYQAGIGTYTPTQIPGLLTLKVYKTIDLMIVCSLDVHIMDGYQFLMQNYHAGDRICIFGFSRGVYTARSLAGMIHKVGLLAPDNWQQIPFAYKMYTRKDPVGWNQSKAFKKAFCMDVPIEFIGVWDTIDSVGLIPKQLPFTVSNTIIRTFHHTVSLDEHRAKFKANLWHWMMHREMELAMESGIEWHPDNGRSTDVEEVWFAGCHCDVGGGSMKNSMRYSLARITLQWMIRECFKVETGIMFDSDHLREIGIDPATLYPSVKPRPQALSVRSAMIQNEPKNKPLFKRILSTFWRHPLTLPDAPDKHQTLAPEAPSVSMNDEQCLPIGTEEEEELRNALSPIYDQLKRSKFWWILELLPIEFIQQMVNDKWVRVSCINLGRPREIPNSSSRVKVHRSVRMRMEAVHEHNIGNKYEPKAHFKNPIWIDDD
ncbi:uncharacterized protein EV420DRAFT_1271376 [Desarmillaria tabescens]|uniref:T6SS Phospholipase effector Tle1-like catalytic domain-containing protein n=1 Tax=Armillaria tabescens TaxID=1929756 RepID=A0AA39KAL9_ARMTA|nr:uncharacterized protein EV420DRAFT_1271376 [Desarmillaria tabescens]KAK0457570.1 hypothetical protein EV420DRAFT_1271376 [Desarmillaria tabescens]